MKTRIQIYAIFTTLTLTLMGILCIHSSFRLYETERSIVEKDIINIIKSQGFTPFAGICIAEKDGITYSIPCADLLTEKQKVEFRQSKYVK